MSRSDYLAFGGHNSASGLDLPGTQTYLEGLGYGNGDLRQARDAIERGRDPQTRFESFGGRSCDFCMSEMMGGEYELLKDGRERCSKCSRTVIATEDRFADEFREVRRNMELAFGISMAGPITVRMVNARAISKQTGMSFNPTPGVDGRVLGFADPSTTPPLLYVENGSPRTPSIATMAHELTHIWQFANWDVAGLGQRRGPAVKLVVMEGMAMWAEIQYLLFIREFAYAQRMLEHTLAREDEYGVGLAMYIQHYGLHEDGDAGADTPFTNPMPG